MTTSVLITGAGSGFGRGAAVELARRGHPVIATTVSDAEAADLASAHPELTELTAAKLDITDAHDRQQVEQWRVDVLVNNAGLGQVGPLRSIPLDRIRRVFETNVFGTLAMSQAVIPQMFERGSGFNDRMIEDPGDWFDRDSARPEELDFLERARQRITVNQLDPTEVVQAIADLVDADETQLINFVPPDVLARMGLDKRH